MNSKIKKDIYKAFCSGTLLVRSVSIDKKIEWKRVLDVMQHNVSKKDQYRVCLGGKLSCTCTGDHSLYKIENEKLTEAEVRDSQVGEFLVIIKKDKIVEQRITSRTVLAPQKFMYDLEVEDNHNFILNSGVLAHNSFRPPASEKFIQGQTQVFGFIWEDEELLEYLYMAIDDFNTYPPVTGIQVADLWGGLRRWRTAILMRAAAFACFAIALNWISEEFQFSISGETLDIEKSSKYQAIKDEFIQEYDKILQGAKESIKIIRGLRQQKFGVGVQSALGPLSRPGVQSRSNYISGGFAGSFS
jgi:hypothetical protein